MQYVVFFLILLFYLYRTFSQAQKKAKQDAERRRQANQQMPPSPGAPQPKTLQDVLTEVFRETEMKTKPFGDGRTIPPVVQPKKTYEQKPVLQKPVTTTYSQTTYSQKSLPQKKKEVKPFLTTDYSPKTIEPEGTPSPLSQQYIQKTQVSDAYGIKNQEGGRVRFNLRDAVIAKIILDRPEW